MHRAGLMAVLALVASTAAAAGPKLLVSHAWIRLLPGNLPLAGYFDLDNAGDHTLSLTGAESTEFARIELHRSMEMQGMAHMMPVERVEVPAGSEVKFAPGGYHLMLFDRRDALQVGAHVTIVLKFADGQSQAATFVVRSAEGQ